MGIDIELGTYVTDVESGICYVSIVDAEGDLRNPTFTGRAIITISSKDSTVETRGCGEWELRLSGYPGILATRFEHGMYEVGVDIRPGIYTSSANDGRCVWFTVDDFSHRPARENLITWWKTGTPIVEIPSDANGFYSIRCGTWERREGSVTPDTPLEQFSDGSYLVGIDIAPGTYATDAGEGICNWFRTAPFGDTVPDNSGGYVSVGRQIATVLPTDTSFFSEGCGTWNPLEEALSDSQPEQTIRTGTLAVGAEVQPGIYFANAAENRVCRWFTLRGFAGRPDDIVSSGIGILRGIVELHEDVIGFRSVDCEAWTFLEDRLTDITIPDSFSDGEHIVNLHVAPGIYTSPGPENGRCSWRRFSGFNDSIENQTAVRNPVGRNIAEITDKDVIFKTFGCGSWERLDLDDESMLLDSFVQGTWGVNTEVTPGTYVADIPDGRTCFWSRLSAFTGEPADFTATDSAIGQSVATVQHFDVGFYSDGCGAWQLASGISELGSPAPKTEFADGVHIVGRDIAPGTYLASGLENEICFWSRLDGFDGDPFNRLTVYASSGQAIATVLASDEGFRSFGCGVWRTIDTGTKLESFSDGTYRVSVDINPGTYIATSALDATCKWRRISDFTWTTGVTAESIASGQKIVTISEDDVGFYSFGCGEWQPFNIDDAKSVETMPRRFSNGSYLVGVHIEPGSYYSIPRRGAGCRWQRVRGFTGDAADVVSRGKSDDRWIVTIAASDVGFVTQGCGIWRNLDTALKIGPFSSFTDGVYRIGADIVPGTYVASVPVQEFIDGQPVPQCGWQTLSDFSHSGDGVIESGSGRGRIEVVLNDYNAGFMSSDCGEWHLLPSLP